MNAGIIESTRQADRKQEEARLYIYWLRYQDKGNRKWPESINKRRKIKDQELKQ